MRNSVTFPHLGTLALLTIACSFIFNAQAASAQANNPPAQNNQKWNYDEIKRVPEKARLRQNPFESDPDAIRAGGKLFERSCAECHGMKAAGGRRAPSLMRDEVQQAPPGVLFWVLTNGAVRHGMPVWSKLPEPQRWQIVTFLKSLKSIPNTGRPSGG